MEETKPTSKFRRFADKLAVEEEPGLRTSQLMLTNYDLKPVEVSSSFVMLPFALRPSAACFSRGCRNPILKPVSFGLSGDICTDTTKSLRDGHGDGQTTSRSGSRTVLISTHGV